MTRATIKTAAAALVASAVAFTISPLAGAHHSVAGQFDIHHTVTLSGTVAKVHWVNPHIYIDFDVKSPGDQAASWRLEGVPVGMARKAGLTMSMRPLVESASLKTRRKAWKRPCFTTAFCDPASPRRLRSNLEVPAE